MYESTSSLSILYIHIYVCVYGCVFASECVIFKYLDLNYECV